MIDVVVVGGGPAGLIAAENAASKDIKVRCIEEHQTIGHPPHCAGLLNIGGLKSLNLPIKGHYVRNQVRGAVFHGIDGSTLKIEDKAPRACVVDRANFDQFLAKKAQAQNVDLVTGKRGWPIKPMDGYWVVNVGKDQIKSKVLVCAEGIAGQVSRVLKLPLPRPLLPSAQCVVSLKHEIDPRLVHVYLNRKYAEGFFAWIIPLNPERVRVGLATAHGSPRRRLEMFLKDIDVLVETATEWSSHCVLTGGPVTRTYTSGALLVGDAAGQVKSTTGGGVITGGLCAEIAGKVVADAVLQNDWSSNFLSTYEKSWKKLLSKEFHTMQFARKIGNIIPDKLIARILGTLNQYTDLIVSHGDIDRQSRIIYELVKKPKIPLLLLHGFLLSILR